MQTPNDKAGMLTEAIMTIFWSGKIATKLPTNEYNKVYSHVYEVLSTGGCK